MPKKVYDPCKKAACKIQSCLQGKLVRIQFSCIISRGSLKILVLENNYQEDKCAEVLEAMRLCCLKWKEISLCCEGIEIEKEKQQKREEK